MQKITFGDILLKVFKCLVFSVELRHRCLHWLAWSYCLFPKKAYEQQPCFIDFWDGSIPWKVQSPIFLAAGASKNAKCVMSFFNMGFGGVTVGSVTLTPHIGNTHRPRVSLIPEDKSIQNAMGLGNDGLLKVLERLKNQSLQKKKSSQSLKIGLSITKNPGSEIGEDAKQEMMTIFKQAYNFVNYFEFNLSCPNTGSARIDQYLDFAEELIKSIANERINQKECKSVFIKLSPDMKESVFEHFLDLIEKYGLTGVVLANTFPLIEPVPFSMRTPFTKIKVLNNQGGKGGLSGQVLYQNTLKLVQRSKKFKPKLSVIAVGGMDSGEKAKELLNAGADVVQCYSVLAYQWNAVGRMLNDLTK